MKLLDAAVRSSSAGVSAERVASGGELHLTDVALSDTGTYWCNATNSKGSVTARAMVRVTGQPRTILLSYGIKVSCTFCVRS